MITFVQQATELNLEKGLTLIFPCFELVYSHCCYSSSSTFYYSYYGYYYYYCVFSEVTNPVEYNALKKLFSGLNNDRDK